MFLHHAAKGGWPLILTAALLIHPAWAGAQEAPSEIPAPEPIREEPLPPESLAQPVLPTPIPAPAPLSLLETLTQARHSLHFEPDAQEPRLTLGRALFQLGDTDGAIDEYQQPCVESRPHVQ